MNSDELDEGGDPQEEAIEEIRKRGKCIFSHHWDSDGPGSGAGCEKVYLWQGKFAYVSLDFDSDGPFESLEAVFAAHPDLLRVNPTTEAIRCSLLTAEQLAALLEPLGQTSVDLNRETWVYDQRIGRWQREELE